MNVSIQLDCDQITNLVFADLKETRQYFMEELDSANTCIFSHNDAYDKAQILKHIEAIDVILEWYRDPSA